MDDIERIINFGADVMAKALGKEPPSKEIIIFDEIENSYELYEAVFHFLENGDISQAENLLFEAIDRDYTENNYLVGKEFYAEVAKLTDEYLEAHNFSRDEVRQGLKDLEEKKLSKLVADKK